MLKSTKTILDKLCFQVFKDSALVYFNMDHSGKIALWGGNFSELSIQIPEKDSHISDVIIFMEGILPLKSDSMEFSCIKMPSRSSVDALLFKIEDGYGLIIWDTSKKEAQLTQMQQECNELNLLIEAQRNRVIHHPDKGSKLTNDIFLEDLFLDLNLAVMEMNEQGHFVLIGTPPSWIEQIPESNQILSGKGYEENIFSFLGNFIQETKIRWSTNHKGRFKSGLWIEKDQTGQELLFDATALDIHGRKLIIISHDICHPNERQSIIQKGRNIALNYQKLKQSDQKLRNKQGELELQVKERTKELEEANLRLANELRERKKMEKEREDVTRQLRQSQKMEAIGTLAGGIAHDFNNILSAIMGFTELSIIETDDDSIVQPRLKKILHASSRAKELVKQILMFSHQSDYEKRPLKIKHVIVEALNFLRASLPASIEIKTNLQSNAYILADQTQLHQVIMNLCTNAWHAMKEKGGTLQVDLTEKEVTASDPNVASGLVSGPYLKLTITDTGCGMPPDVLEKIFDPYFTTKDKNKGTGLGLSVVHGIVTKYNGCIIANSNIGKGSVFKIYLPSFDAPQQVNPVQKPVPFGKKERILFVDDEYFQGEMAEQLLHHLGYEVVVCNDAIKALNLFLDAKENFDLVITDMIMPKMTGKTLAKKLHEIKPDIPVILCSGYSEDIDPDTIRKSGITQYLMKPIGIRDLALAVHNALQK